MAIGYFFDISINFYLQQNRKFAKEMSKCIYGKCREFVDELYKLNNFREFLLNCCINIQKKL